MKKFISILLVAIMAVSALTGCSGSKGGTVSTDGSTSMEKVIGALGESFENDNSGVTFTYNPTGSGSGIKAVFHQLFYDRSRTFDHLAGSDLVSKLGR